MLKVGSVSFRQSSISQNSQKPNDKKDVVTKCNHSDLAPNTLKAGAVGAGLGILLTVILGGGFRKLFRSRIQYLIPTVGVLGISAGLSASVGEVLYLGYRGVKSLFTKKNDVQQEQAAQNTEPNQTGISANTVIKWDK